MKKFIVCANYNEYHRYLRETNQAPRECVYINQEHQLRGIDLKEVEFVQFGRWWLNPLVQKIGYPFKRR